MSVSVVVPLRNSASTIGQQLEAISQQKCTDWWEVVVADNGSTDSSVNVVRTYELLLGACDERLLLLWAVDTRLRLSAGIIFAVLL